MNRKKEDQNLDRLIRSALQTNAAQEAPSPALNNRLKANLYQKEAILRQNTKIRTIPVWYLPMIINFIIFSMLTVLAFLLIPNRYLAALAAAVCIHIILAGFVLTIAGIRRTDIKTEMSIQIEKRGVQI